MNKNRPTAGRVSWTTEALNFFLEFQEDIDNLRITKEDREQGFATGTMNDAMLIYNRIVEKLGVTNAEIMKYKVNQTNFWYSEEEKSKVNNSPPVSNTIKAAFGEVGDLYLKHQHTWDNAAEVEDVASEDEEDDMEENKDEI